MTNLKGHYDWQPVEIRLIAEKSVELTRISIELLAKILPAREYYLLSYRVAVEYHRSLICVHRGIG